MLSPVRIVALMIAGLLGLPGCGEDNTQGPYVDECSGDAGATHSPSVSIRNPGSSSAFSSSEDIEWLVEISDEDTELADIILELLDYESGQPEPLDLVLPNPDSTGEARFTLPGGNLDPGLHPLHVKATDPDGCTARDDVLVCIDRTSCP